MSRVPGRRQASARDGGYHPPRASPRFGPRCAREDGKRYSCSYRAGHVPDADPTTDTLVGIEFPDVFRAQEFLTATTGWPPAGDIECASRDRHQQRRGPRHGCGKPRPATSTSAASGAIWAGLFGLILGGPVGWIAGTAVGAAGGAITAKVVDHGIPDEGVDWFRQAVRPGRPSSPFSSLTPGVTPCSRSSSVSKGLGSSRQTCPRSGSHASATPSGSRRSPSRGLPANHSAT